MAECRFEQHEWASEVVDRPFGEEDARLYCVICGVGHTVGFAPTARGSVEVSLTVFPADGEARIDREIIRWSIASLEQTIADMEGGGVDVIRGDVVLLGEPYGL